MNELINLGNRQFVKVTMLKGEKGSNIATITKTGTSGLVDTYTVTLTDGSTTTFQVTNGSSIESIEKTGTVGLVDIYTITLTNGETSTFEVTNGNAENLQDAFQALQCAIKAGVSQVTFTNLGDAYITYIPNSECVENAVVVVGFDNGAMYKGTMNYSSEIGRWGLSNIELIQGSDVPSTWMVGYGDDSVGTRAFRTGTDFVYSNGIGIALSTSSDVVSYYCVLSSGKVSDNYLQTQIKQINSDLADIDSASISAELSGVIIHNNRVHKNAKVVHLYALMDIPAISASGEWIASIPSEFRPSSERAIVGIGVDGIPKAFDISPSGHIRNMEAIPNKTYYFDSTWIL